jgi:small conductance mechanosensitive channel
VLLSLGASSVDWQVRVWVQSSEYFPTMDALTQHIKDELDAAGIGIPYQTLDVNLVK